MPTRFRTACGGFCTAKVGASPKCEVHRATGIFLISAMHGEMEGSLRGQIQQQTCNYSLSRVEKVV